ncbi:MAG: NYN domain-containing protein [Ktedonobacterales bacterium]
MSDEIALFIDFENIRYSLINVHHREPDPQELIGVARRYGTVMVARAYADWSRQPEFFKGSLTAAMIDRVDCPAKVRERFRQTQMPPIYAAPHPYDRAPDRDDQDPDAEYDDPLDLEDQEGAEARAELRDDGMGDLETGELRMRQNDELGDDEQPMDEGDEGELQQRQDDSRYGYNNNYNNYNNYPNNPQPYQQPQPVVTQSTVDLNMLMDIIETVFDRPSINTFVLMSGDRDFTRICARLKLRLNKHVIVVGIPGTVSRDLISAAEQFIPLGFGGATITSGGLVRPQGPVDPEEAGFIQFLDYIDRHWSWRTIGGVANFIGDPFNPKNRFRGRLTRESARDLLRLCIDEGILSLSTDQLGNENLRLNREHPAVAPVLSDPALNMNMR